MRLIFLSLFLVLFVSCNKIDEIKVEKIFESKDSASSDSKDSLKEKRRITTSEASLNIGKNVILAGHVAQVTKRNKVSYLNFDYKYPKHTFAGVIFAGDYGKIGDVSVYEGKNVELTGTITEYNGKPQMILSSPEQIKIIK